MFVEGDARSLHDLRAERGHPGAQVLGQAQHRQHLPARGGGGAGEGGAGA